MLGKDSEYFLEMQTHTGWGRTLYGFAEWCAVEPGWITLDVGCGPGLLPAILTKMGCNAFGLDLDPEMFRPAHLHPEVLIGDVNRIPLASKTFNMVTATNLIFLLAEPIFALIEMKRLLRPGGKLAMLNPSENLSEQAALDFADDRGMEGIARATLLNWARRAEQNHHWNEDETRDLYSRAGLRCRSCILKVGPGFGRFSDAIA